MKNEILLAPKIEFRDFLPENSFRLAFGGKRFKNQYKENSQEIPLVSIVTIVFNGEKYLKDTIQSVLNQDYPNIEYIVIDGGSTDKTQNIIREYQEKIDIWYSEPDLGISDAFNKGILLCRGEFIGLINSDDWYEKEAVSILVKSFNERKFDLFCGRLDIWYQNKNAYSINSSLSALNSRMGICHPTVFVKRNIYQELGGYDLNFKFAMDYDFLLRVRAKGIKIEVTKQKLTNMRDEGTSKINKMKGQAEVLKIKNNYYGLKFSHYLSYFSEWIKSALIFWIKKFKLNSIYSFCGRILQSYRNSSS